MNKRNCIYRVTVRAKQRKNYRYPQRRILPIALVILACEIQLQPFELFHGSIINALIKIMCLHGILLPKGLITDVVGM